MEEAEKKRVKAASELIIVRAFLYRLNVQDNTITFFQMETDCIV